MRQTIKESSNNNNILYTKSSGEYLEANSSGHGYAAYNKFNVYLGHISADSDEEAINKFMAKEPEYESLEEATNYDFTRYKLHAEIVIEREYGEDAEYHLMNYHKYYQAFEPEYILLYELIDQGKFIIVTTSNDAIEEFDTITEANNYWDEFFSEPEDEESFVKDAADNWHTQEW